MPSSSSNTHWIYDVFLSFRGEDTRYGFVSHLHAALARQGINAFIDYRLKKGTELGPELERAIQGSQISIIVFSENYASSRWCLKELVKIAECSRTYRQKVLPIFYHVDPSNVRKQKGAFGERLEALVEECLLEGSLSLLMSWTKALSEIADFSGWHLRDRSEAEEIERITERVLEMLDRDLLAIPVFPVGLELRVQQVIEFIRDHSRTGCVVGIWGMGGLGKTTLAKFAYNQIFRRFKHRKFIENIREVCENDSRGCIALQEQLLSGLLKEKVNIDSTGKGITMIEKRLSVKGTLIVLDDVSEFEQFKALCGNRKWIGPGNVLIITTRNVRLLNVLKVDHIVHICRIKEMDEDESLKLFRWHAFREASPGEDFIKLSTDVVAYCKGLPLALEVLGSYLFERPKEEWKSVLSKLKEIPDKQVQEKLKISYDGLDGTEKNIFLDICFFFIGKHRADVTEILEGCGLHPVIGISILVERSLIKLDKNNKLRMHDLLRDMGREIVRQSSPNEPENRSRLWVHKEVVDVLTQHTGTKAIEGLALKRQSTNGLHFETEAFKEMKKLRLLQLDHVHVVGDYEYLSKNLRWVCWQGFPLRHMPDNLHQEYVISIELKCSNISQVWKKPKLLPALKILNLSHSKNLTHTPDFSKLPNLAKLILKDCPNLSEVHQSIGDLRKLLMINLMNCTSLSNLPRRVYQIKSVETLILSGCSKIDKLEDDIVQMESLTTLIAKDTSVKEMPRSIARLKSIGYISLCGHEGLARDIFPSLIWSWMSPTANLRPYTQPCENMSNSSMDICHNNLGDLSPMLGGYSKHRSILVQYDSKLRRMMDGLCDVKFTEMERTSYASQISENAMESYLIGMGSYDQVIDKLNKSISEIGSLEDDGPRKRGNHDSEASGSGSGSVGTKRGVLRNKKICCSNESDVDEEDDYYPPSTKKPRVVWSDELHQAFLNAVRQLEREDKVVPKKILQIMNIPDLTRENVASPLQKYRDQIKKEGKNDGKTAQQNGMALPNTSSSGASGSSRGTDFRNLASTSHVPYQTVADIHPQLTCNLMPIQQNQWPNHSHAEYGESYNHLLARIRSQTSLDDESICRALLQSNATMRVNRAVENQQQGNHINNVMMNTFLQQQQQQALVHRQLQINPASVTQNRSIGGNPVTNYGLQLAQLNNSLGVVQIPGENNNARGIFLGYAATPATVSIPLQGGAVVRSSPATVSDTQFSYGHSSNDSLYHQSLNHGYDGSQMYMASTSSGLENESSEEPLQEEDEGHTLS